MDHQLSVSIPNRSPEMIEDRLSDQNVNVVEDNQAEVDSALESMPMPMSNLDRSSVLTSLLATTYSPPIHDSGRRSRRANTDGPPPKVQVLNCADGVNQVNPVRYGGGRASMNTFIMNSGINW
jgi:hypothetical protein